MRYLMLVLAFVAVLNGHDRTFAQEVKQGEPLKVEAPAPAPVNPLMQRQLDDLKAQVTRLSEQVQSLLNAQPLLTEKGAIEKVRASFVAVCYARGLKFSSVSVTNGQQTIICR